MGVADSIIILSPRTRTRSQQMRDRTWIEKIILYGKNVCIAIVYIKHYAVHAYRLFKWIQCRATCCTQWRSQGFQCGGVKGRVRKFFKLHMHAGEFKSNFHTKINTLTPVFMPLSFATNFQITHACRRV
jgi:hypothetical protein